MLSQFQWALADARDTIDKTKKKKSVLPVDRMHSLLQKVIKARQRISMLIIKRNCLSILGSASVQNRQLSEPVPGRRARIHLGRHPKARRQLRQEHEARRDNAGGRADSHSGR